MDVFERFFQNPDLWQGSELCILAIKHWPVPEKYDNTQVTGETYIFLSIDHAGIIRISFQKEIN